MIEAICIMLSRPVAAARPSAKLEPEDLARDPSFAAAGAGLGVRFKPGPARVPSHESGLGQWSTARRGLGPHGVARPGASDSCEPEGSSGTRNLPVKPDHDDDSGDVT
jgi:hypothetical protein